MAEQRSTVPNAKVISIGELEQVTPKFAKWGFEYTIGDSPEVYSADCPSWHRGSLEVGSTYELKLKARERSDGDFYTPSLDEKPVLVTGVSLNGSKPDQATAAPAKKPVPVPSVNQQPAGRRPELNARWVQYSTHFRTAHMQATERVGQYIQLSIAGRLVTDDDEPIKAVRKSTVESWYNQEVNRYLEEVLEREPNDVFGNLKDGS